MNPSQKLVRSRAQRRFTRGDGVHVDTGELAGRSGVVTTWRDSDDDHDEEALRLYRVEFDDELQPREAEVLSGLLSSRPELNTGKYGGELRGGNAGGWVGGNNYRRRR